MADGKPELAGLWKPGAGDIQITIDDPKAYTRPWTVTVPLTFQADDELMEYICNENNKYFGLEIK